jgi:hypothetical protein
MTEILRNNPPDVVYAAFRAALFKGTIRMFQRDNEMRNIMLVARGRRFRTGIAAGFVWCSKPVENSRTNPHETGQAIDGTGRLFPPILTDC